MVNKFKNDITTFFRRNTNKIISILLILIVILGLVFAYYKFIKNNEINNNDNNNEENNKDNENSNGKDDENSNEKNDEEKNDKISYNGWSYVKSTQTITWYNGVTSGTSITVPSEIMGNPVKKLETWEAFSYTKSINKIIISEGIEILKGAFQYTPNITEVVLPTTLKEIQTSTFQNTSIVEIVIPEGVTYIGVSAFANIKTLKKVSIPSTITRIDSWAFGDSDNVEEILVNMTQEQFNQVISASGHKDLYDYTLMIHAFKFKD